MRYIRNTVAAVATASALLLTGTTAMGVAQARPTQPAQPAQPANAKSLYAPSALVLSFSRGEDAATATVERAVTLNCAPRPAGTHPAPAAACAELSAVNGEFAVLTEKPSHKTCTRQWSPVVISAQGVWQGKHVTWSATYGNECEMEGSMAGGKVFAF